MGITGIDFGTTNTAVAYYDEETRRVIEVPWLGQGQKGLKKTLPSIVAFDEEGNPLYVGDAALSYQRAHPRLCVDKIKRLIGKSYEQALADPLLDKIAYEVVKGEETSGGQHVALVRVGDREKKTYLPEEIAALIFKEARRQVEAHLEKIGCSDKASRVVVTVPANFDVVRRSRIRDAAILAMFEEEKIELLNEPTAAVFDAIAGGKVGRNDKVLVFNIGAGTTDLAVVEVRMPGTKLIVKSWAVAGEAELGGTDMDIAIADWVFDRLRGDPKVDQVKLGEIRDALNERLRLDAEDAKIALSEGKTHEVDIGIAELLCTVRLSSTDLNEIVRPIVQRCKESIRVAMARATKTANIMLENIDKVILTGGPMTMPVVRSMATDEFGNRIVDGVDPMMCVAAGAAIKPTATGAIAPPSHNIYLSIEGSRTSLKVEEVVTIFEPLPTEKLFQWTVQPSEPEIRIQVLQEPQKRSSKNVYLTTAKYVFSITPPTGRKDYFLLCSVGTEEDKITVTVFDSRVEAERVLENQDASREVPFRFRRFKDMGEIKIATGETDVKDEKERVREAFWFRAPLVQSILGESTDLWRAAKALSRAGYRPPPSLENMAMMAENLFNVVYHRIDSQLQMMAAQNLPDHELERSVSALADRILTSSEFRTLSQLTNSNDWKERMREWTVPVTGIRSLVEAIANMKVEAKSALDRIKPENSTEDKQRIERLLDELDSIQSRLQGAGEVSVLSTNGRLFIEGKTKLEQLRSWVDAL